MSFDSVAAYRMGLVTVALLVMAQREVHPVREEMLGNRGRSPRVLVGIISGCNLTASSPPSRPPQVGREKPRVQPPTLKPGTSEPVSSVINNRNLILGNPSNAASSVASIDNY